MTSYCSATQARRAINRIIAELAALKDSRKLFFFVDDNIVSNPKFAKAFYRELIPLKIRWVSPARLRFVFLPYTLHRSRSVSIMPPLKM